MRVGGLVTSVRPYTTKTNKPMGFVTLEDIQGNFDLVLFPPTWERTREMLTVGQIVIVEGKVDTNSAPPKILVDTVRTEIKIVEPLGDSTKTPPHPKPQPAPDLEALSQPKPFDKAQDKPDSHVKNLNIKSTQPKPIVPPQPKPVMPQPVMQAAEKKEPYSVGRDAIPPYDDLNGMPPPPDNFPDDWDTQWCSKLNYLVGLRLAQSQQIMTSEFSFNGVQTVETDVDFYGAGLKLGLEYERMTKRGFLMYAKGNASFVPGEFHTTYRQFDESDPSTVNTGWRAGRLVTMLDLEVGDGWVSCCGRYRMTAGYLFQSWYNTWVQTDEWIKGVRTNNFVDMSSMMTFDGLMARVEARF